MKEVATLILQEKLEVEKVPEVARVLQAPSLICRPIYRKKRPTKMGYMTSGSKSPCIHDVTMRLTPTYL